MESSRDLQVRQKMVRDQLWDSGWQRSSAQNYSQPTPTFWPFQEVGLRQSSPWALCHYCLVWMGTLTVRVNSTPRKKTLTCFVSKNAKQRQSGRWYWDSIWESARETQQYCPKVSQAEHNRYDSKGNLGAFGVGFMTPAIFALCHHAHTPTFYSATISRFSCLFPGCPLIFFVMRSDE